MSALPEDGGLRACLEALCNEADARHESVYGVPRQASVWTETIRAALASVNPNRAVEMTDEERSGDEALARRCAAAEARARARCVKRAEVRMDATEVRSLLARVAAASPTPTGPEPWKCARPGRCACEPLRPGDEHCRWFPATPEPTEETPNPCDSPLVTRECQEVCGPCWDVGGCALHDEARRRADR